MTVVETKVQLVVDKEMDEVVTTVGFSEMVLRVGDDGRVLGIGEEGGGGPVVEIVERRVNVDGFVLGGFIGEEFGVKVVECRVVVG